MPVIKSAVSAIVKSLSKGIKAEAIPMSKIAWEMKYNLASPGSNTMRLLPFKVDTPQGQRSAVEFLKSVAKEKNTRMQLDEITSLMDNNIFTYEDALKAGVVKEPVSAEQRLLDGIFKGFD